MGVKNHPSTNKNTNFDTQLELLSFVMKGLKYKKPKNYEDYEMEQEKDNTLAVVIGVTLIAIAGVFMLKSRETEHLQYSGETTAAAEAQVLSKAKSYNNDILSQVE